MLRVLNTFIEALNRHPYLPQMIIIMLDQDLLSMLDLDVPGLTTQLECCISWLAKQFTREIEARKEKLHSRCPGALPQSDESPTLIWMELYDKPYTRNQFVQENRNKFNRGLNEVALREKNCRIMTIQSFGIRPVKLPRKATTLERSKLPNERFHQQLKQPESQILHCQPYQSFQSTCRPGNWRKLQP